MLITVCSGVGSGPTKIGAFDAALRDAGVENYNLIPLSSVIPPNATIQRNCFTARLSEYGHRLYVVLSRSYSTDVGQAAWAGLGWTLERETGRGLFVEIDGFSRREVEKSIEATLESMKPGRRYDYGKNESELIGIECSGPPVCAVVVAAYSSEGWRA